MFATLVALFLSNAAAPQVGAVAGSSMVEPDPKAMAPREIRAHNNQLDRKHSYYIRCVKAANVGSLVASNVSCQTSRQWATADRVGNDEVWDIIDKMASKFWDFEQAEPKPLVLAEVEV